MIFLKLHMSESESKLFDHVLNYNRKMKKEHGKEATKHTLKKTHIETARALLKAYMKHLQEQSETRIVENNPEPGFLINNQAIATMLNQDRKSSYNQIKRLQSAKIITSKTFRGSNARYRIVINKKILVACENYQFTERLTQFFVTNAPENIKNDPETLKKVKSAKPDFAYFFAGYGEFFHDIATSTLQDHNINIDKGIVVENTKINQTERKISHNQNEPNSLKSVFSNNGFITQDHSLEHPLNKDVFSEKETQKKPDENVAQQNIPQKQQTQKEIYIRELVRASWLWMISHLYHKNAFFDQHHKHIALQFLHLYYENRDTSQSTLNIAFSDFCQRVLLARNFYLNKPGRFIPNPHRWLDPTFEHGFEGTGKWLKLVKQKRDTEKEYYSHIQLVSKLYREFTLSPTMQNYESATQRLGKLRNKKFLELYQTAIVNKNPKIIENYGKVA